MKRKVCIITGSRADYGLLNPLMDEVGNAADLALQLVATGTHLSPEFGLTYKEIEHDGFHIDEKIEILLSSDSPVGISKSMGLAMGGFAEAYGRLAPDIIVVLGDRYEIFCAVAAALVGRIPVSHIHGGEITEGVIDDSFRHSITKMSLLHFTSTGEYRERVIQLGEHPDRVFNVGAIGLDNIRKLKLFSKRKLEDDLKFRFNKHNFLITFHPATLENNTSGMQFNGLLNAVDRLKDTNFIFTKANSDTDGRIINKMIDEYVSVNSDKAVAFHSMGQLRYLSAMQFVDAVVGNSSSGIIEAPSFKIGTINIGDRQKGRIRAKSVIDCGPDRKKIESAISRLYSDDFRKALKHVVNPYGDGNTSVRIRKVLKAYNIKDGLKKIFYDTDITPVKNIKRRRH